MSQTLAVGFDDTDSPKGMCTTFLAYKIVNALKMQDVEFLDLPRLVRFNPNIPWKTRGNGAVSLKIRTGDAARIKELVGDLVQRYADTENGANPGLVFFEGADIPDSISKFSSLALWQLISRGTARRLAVKNDLDFSYMGNGQGLVGAIGAIGYTFGDHTLELLSYRKSANFGKKRQISLPSVLLAHKKNPDTFNCVDERGRKMLIAPHGPDPVFYGIRGENAGSLIRAAKDLEFDEELDGHMIFRTNQGTGDHLKNKLGLADARPYASGMLEGIIGTEPEMARGGHVFFTVKAEREIRCAIYRPTKLSHMALGLIPGDRVCVGGGIRKASKNFPRVLNVEFIRVLGLNQTVRNPVCNGCSKSMKSKGVGQGYQCPRCGRRAAKKLSSTVPRRVKKQLYLPAVSAQRHLTRPMKRMGRRNTGTGFDKSLPWVCEYMQ